MTIENLDAIMRRIQKMLAIANDHRADPNEASAAAAMAERIMRKYQIDHADIVLADVKRGDNFCTEDCVATAKTNGTLVKEIPLWASILGCAIAKLNDCGATRTREDGEARVRFFGFKYDVMVAKWMFDYLVATTNQLCNQFKKTDAYSISASPRAAVAAYRRGVASSIASLIEQAIKNKAAEVQTSTGTSIVVAKQNAIAQRFGDNVFETKRAEVMHRNADAFSQGRADGRKVDINRRAISGAPSPLMIGRK